MIKHEDIIVGRLYEYHSGLEEKNYIYRPREHFLLIENGIGWQAFIRLNTGRFHTWAVSKTLEELKLVKK